jgi:hypothetical protein
MVGRRGLEPRTSALLGPERSTTETGTPYETAGVIRPAPVSATKFEERPLRGAKFDSQNHYCREAGRAVKRVFPGANCCLMYFLNPTDHIITPEVGYGQSIVLTHLCALQAEGEQRSGNLAPCSDPTAASFVGCFRDTGGRLTRG